MLLWFKALHLIFAIAWFAGLFYLPRLFVYHADTQDQIGYDRFCIMEKRLSILMSIAALLTVVFGVLTIAQFGMGWFAHSGWLHAKLVLIVLLIGYHGWCQAQVGKFRAHRNTGSRNFFRWMNELPTLFLVLIVILAVVKPF